MTKLTKGLSAGLALGLVSLAFGDTIRLKNGNAVQGTYLGGTAREIRMDLGDHVQTFSVDSVDSVQFGGGSPQASYSQPQNQPPSYNNNDSDVRPHLKRSQGSDDSFPQGPGPGLDSQAPVGGIELPSGTQLTVRMIDAVDSETARLGDTFHASMDEPVSMNGQVVIPRGADVVAKLVEDEKSGKLAGKTVLKLVLSSVQVNGRMVDVTTQDVIKESGSRTARSGKVIGGTAALGAIIGGIAGGGRGAAIGAGSGAAVGTGAQEVGKGQRVKIPSETRLVFILSYAVRV